MKHVLTALILILLSGALHAADEPMTYRYWDWGITPSKDDYQVALLKLTLDKTISSYGPYRIERVVKYYSRARARREVNRGEILNVYFIPFRSKETDKKSAKANLLASAQGQKNPSAEPTKLDEEYEQDGSIPVMMPGMKGLMGYRNLIIRRSDEEKFKKITEERQLKNLVAGQGDDWIDISIYKHNGYSVVAPATYSALFDMLAAGRFDYLPLGATEVEAALLQHPELHSKLMIAPELIIYYPYALLFHVSKKHPRLAERLEAGMKIAQRDGSLDKLFNQHFSKEIAHLANNKTRYFILENPAIPKSMGLDKPLLPGKSL